MAKRKRDKLGMGPKRSARWLKNMRRFETLSDERTERLFTAKETAEYWRLFRYFESYFKRVKAHS
jgi:hypothetical protein